MTHKNILPIILLLLTFGLSVVHGQAYDLESYLRKVKSDNPDLALSRQNVAASVESVKMARSALLPSVGVSAGYVRNLSDIEEPKAVASPSGGGALIYQDVDTNFDNELSLAAGLNQKLFDPGAIANYEQAKRNRLIQSSIDNFSRQNILTIAKKLYARTQLAFEIVKVREESESTSKDVYDNINRKYRAGVSTELDLRMAEVDWKNDISATAEARKNADLSLMSLKTLAGIPQTEKVLLIEDTNHLPETPELPQLGNVLVSRSDYQARLLAGDIADIAYKSALASYLPTVTGSLAVVYGGYGNDSLTEDYDYTALQFGINVSVPIFTGGYRRSLVKNAEIQKANSGIEIMKMRDEIDQELVSLHLQMVEAEKRIESARLLVEATQRASSLSQTALANGLGTQLAVSQANANLAQSRMNLQYAIYTYRALFYDWELAVGKVE